jgi:lipid-binding SYLF domain-containing protein
MFQRTERNLPEIVLTTLLAVLLLLPLAGPVRAGTNAELDLDVKHALEKLYMTTPVATKLVKKAKGILVFPKVLKAGLMVGGQYGKGALLVNGKTVDYYNTVAGSYGFQIGAQSFGFVMFFMSDEAIQYLNKSEGWEIGVGPSVVFVDDGVAKTLTTTTAKSDIYAFIFDQSGLMAGVGIQGSKITKLNSKKK